MLIIIKIFEFFKFFFFLWPSVAEKPVEFTDLSFDFAVFFLSGP